MSCNIENPNQIKFDGGGKSWTAEQEEALKALDGTSGFHVALWVDGIFEREDIPQSTLDLLDAAVQTGLHPRVVQNAAILNS
jgi:hypothetical protein